MSSAEGRKKPKRSGKKLEVVRSIVSCSVCKLGHYNIFFRIVSNDFVLGVGLLKKEVDNETSFEDIRLKFVNLCVIFKVETEEVCAGIFDVYAPEVLPVLKVLTIGELSL